MMGGFNSLRASASNLTSRGINEIRNPSTINKYEVDDEGYLTLIVGAPRETTKEKVVNSLGDIATIGLAAAGGPEGVLMGQGGKAATLKGVEEIKIAIKAANGNSKASTKAQHVYGLVNKATEGIEKIGISGGKISQSGTSYRATSQVNKLNKQGGNYTSKILKNIPAGPGARTEALKAERQLTNKNKGTINPRIHNRPKPQ